MVKLDGVFDKAGVSLDGEAGTEPVIGASATVATAGRPLRGEPILLACLATVDPINLKYTIMSLYDLHNAKLNEMEGEGFAYSKKTVYGKAYKGVFFGENEEQIEKLADDEEDATFEGILYDRSREREKTFSVEITDVISTPSGERADFIATEKP